MSHLKDKEVSAALNTLTSQLSNETSGPAITMIYFCESHLKKANFWQILTVSTVEVLAFAINFRSFFDGLFSYRYASVTQVK